MKNQKILIILLIVFVFVGFFYLNRVTPLTMDDFNYKYIFKGTQFSQDKVLSISDVLNSQVDHYNCWNGRFIVHTFVQIFIGILGENLIFFDIINSIFFISLILLIVLFVIKKYNIPFTEHIYVLILGLILCWYFIPSPSTTLMWKTGAVNYLWTSVMSLVFIFLFDTLLNNIKVKSFLLPILLLFSFISGWGHEGISFGIASGILLYCFMKYKRLNRSVMLIAISYCCGALMTVVSPGILERASADLSSPSIFVFISKRAMAVYRAFIEGDIIASSILLLLITILFFTKKEILVTFIKNHLLFVLIYISYFVFHIGLAFPGQARGAMGMEVIAILLILFLIFEMVTFSRKIKIILFPILSLLLLFDYVPVALSCCDNYKNVQKVIADYKESYDGVVRSPFPEKYLNDRFIFWEYYSNYNQPQMHAFSKYYDKTKKLSVLEPCLYDGLYVNNDFCINENRIYGSQDFYTLDESSCYVSPLKDNIQKDKVYVSYVAKYEFLKSNKYLKYIYDKIGEYYSSEKSGFILNTKYGKYLLIERLDKISSHIQLQEIKLL